METRVREHLQDIRSLRALSWVYLALNRKPDAINVARQTLELRVRDQCGERGIRVGFAPERVVGHRQADHLSDARSLLDLRQCAMRVAYLQQRIAEVGVRVAPARSEAQHGAARRDSGVEPAGRELVEAQVGDRIAADDGLIAESEALERPRSKMRRIGPESSPFLQLLTNCSAKVEGKQHCIDCSRVELPRLCHVRQAKPSLTLERGHRMQPL